jgi:hypothetical protein
MEIQRNDIGLKTKELGATLFTTKPTWTELGVKLGLCSERPVTNCLSHGMAC